MRQVGYLPEIYKDFSVIDTFKVDNLKPQVNYLIDRNVSMQLVLFT